MRSDEIVIATRKTGFISDAAAWPDISDADILLTANARHLAWITDEIATNRAGYAKREFLITCTPGVQRYPVPDRAIGGGWDALQIQPFGTAEFRPLERVEAEHSYLYDLGPSNTGVPARYSVQDHNVELYKSPNAAYVLRYWYYQRPSQLVVSQSSTKGGDTVVRGLVTAVNKVTRTVTVNVVPFDQNPATGSPAAITTGSVAIDIIRPRGTFPCTMASVPQTLAGSVFTLGGADDMADVQIGDFVRAAEQTDWPMQLPVEWHQMLCDRTAMEILRYTGTPEDAAQLALTVGADMKRYRSVTKPQVKSAPRMIPCRSILSRSRVTRFVR